jgi:SAM-dependent methyltransferase
MSNPYDVKSTAVLYDRARSLPDQTLALWLNALKEALNGYHPRRLLDVGCGTGRFTHGLSQTFGCPVIGIEPSQAMLEVARHTATEDVTWLRGYADGLPLADASADLVFLSQVFHHLPDPSAALQEIRRVLVPGGYMAIRNATLENLDELAWLKCFPEAQAVERGRMVPRAELVGLVEQQGFALTSSQTVRQLFAVSPSEYYGKIQRRGLSALLSISDAAFEAGLERLRQWVADQPGDAPVSESVDLCVFRKQAARLTDEAL